MSASSPVTTARIARIFGVFAPLALGLLLSGCPSALQDCRRASDCDGGACRVATCEAGSCIFVPRNSATLPDDDPNDCVVPACDLEGELIVRNLPKGRVVQGGKVGDCRKRVCDGLGRLTEAADDVDVPASTNPCLAPKCSGGSPLFVPLAKGSKIADTSPTGDCLSTQCDGLGKATLLPDLGDPKDDDDPCTIDYCEAGKTVHVKLPAGVTVADDVRGNCKAVKCLEGGSHEPVEDRSDAGTGTNACQYGSCELGKTVFKPRPPGTVCNSLGGTCKKEGRCDRCPDIDAQCSDFGPGEPNDTAASAHQLPSIDDKDLFQTWPHVCGVLAGKDDVDWYAYNGHDGGGIVDPGRFFRDSDSLQVCAFFQCEKSTDSPKFSCPDATSSATSPSGMPGCCGLEPFKVVLDCLPSGGLFGKDNATVFLRVRSTDDSATCTPYELRYHY